MIILGRDGLIFADWFIAGKGVFCLIVAERQSAFGVLL